MEFSLLILFLIIVSYILGERSFRIRKIPFSTFFSAYGTEFVIIGLLLGPYFLNILSEDRIDQLEPLINIAMGWIGLMFGLQFRLKDLKLLPFSNYYIAGIESSVTILVVFALLSFSIMIFGFEPSLNPSIIPCAIILASISAVSSSAAITSVVKRTKAHGRVSRLIRYTSGLDSVVALTVFGLAYPFFHLTAQRGDAFVPGWGWLLISVAAGLILGVLFHFFVTPKASSNENLMIAVAMVTLSSGIAAYLHLPALFVNMIAGIVLCNYSERQDRFYRLLVSAEKPLYGIILIIAASLWRASLPMLILLVLFVFSRAIAKTLGGWLALKRYEKVIKYPEWFGSALFSQGAMAIAIALDYRFLAPGETSTLFITVILTASTLNSVISLYTTKRFLLREGEIS